ncbi:hypothetical protein V8E36_006813 [Tilletia maclaganii]
MRLHHLLIFTAVLAAVSNVQAYNEERAKKCAGVADTICPSGGPSHGILMWQCMSIWWRTIASSNNCNHPEVDCLCFNGCLKDRRQDQPDVSGFCKDSCGQARKQRGSCS